GSSRVEYTHFAYYQIIGSGPFAVPILLERVKSGSNSWFVALKAISGEMVDTPDMQGNPRAAREAWIEWGKKYDVYSGKASDKLDSATHSASRTRLGSSGLEQGE